MGWKSIELQVAIPRSQDAGKIQQQLLNQSQQYQASLTQHQLLEELRKRKQVNHVHQPHLLKLEHQSKTSQSLAKKKKSQCHTDKHPYLGKEIDLNG
ncbi:hypothetical protein [Virgibacillus pantothenticus]|uniref:hypothetical protein n=1 Tax=Virgibacillus pantothenticus TaxID=1473 RepID=UPI0025B002E4|nr:hypothetical protein [Virgibacillus pantothenticus]